jgi:predicted dehydrogenase
MIGNDGIDLVTIAVKVPAHRELVLAALKAGKAVYCEAPLGCTVAVCQQPQGLIQEHAQASAAAAASFKSASRQ